MSARPIPAPSHYPEGPGGWQVTWKDHLSDGWVTSEFAAHEEAAEFAARIPWVLPDEHGREVVPVG